MASTPPDVAEEFLDGSDDDGRAPVDLVELYEILEWQSETTS